MRFLPRLLCAAIGSLAAMSGGAAGSAPPRPLPPLLPMPASMVAGQGVFVLGGTLAVVADPGDPGAVAAAARLRDLLARSGGPKATAASQAPGGIRFRRDATIAGTEAYRIEVTPGAVTVRASGDAGLFYGAETLWQLVASATDGRIPALTIDDKPASAWRGLMLDSVRHFQPASFIEQTLDRMAEAKLNVFHWHLTDDQGWRLPIDRYPRLAAIGGWRTEAGTGRRYGGIYSKDEVRRIVAYAAARHITVMPEIEMPGHATALLAAYPALASVPHPPVAPGADWGVYPNLLNSEDATFAFMEHVLDEVMALFPGTYIHVGGDEAPKGQWQTDPRAQARIRALGLKDENALQGWFTARIGAYLEAHGRRLVGWDEILEGKVPADATVMSWHGMDGAIAAAKAGHDAILAPMPTLYLDNVQSDAADETPGRDAVIDWQRVYALDIAPSGLTDAERAHILGLQANVWTEHASTPDIAERMAWPRAAAVAELGWSPAGTRDWPAFSTRLVAALGRWDRVGWNYDTVPLDAEARIDAQGVTLAQPAAIGTIRYTIDGSAPTAASPAYSGPIARAGTLRLAAQAFLGAQPIGTARRWTFDDASLLGRSAADMTPCDNKLPLRIEDPVSHVIHPVDVMAACWRWSAAPTAGAVRVTAKVARIPFNYQLGADLADVTFRKPATPAGELEIRQDGCDGPRIAVLPLAAALGPGGATIGGTIAPQGGGAHGLCMTFTQTGPDPLWVLDRLTLEPAR